MSRIQCSATTSRVPATDGSSPPSTATDGSLPRGDPNPRPPGTPSIARGGRRERSTGADHHASRGGTIFCAPGGSGEPRWARRSEGRRSSCPPREGRSEKGRICPARPRATPRKSPGTRPALRPLREERADQARRSIGLRPGPRPRAQSGSPPVLLPASERLTGARLAVTDIRVGDEGSNSATSRRDSMPASATGSTPRRVSP